jgi:hypothetical protein
LDRADFDKSPNSRILFSFKTNENNGLLAFIGQNSTLSDKSNFLAVELVEGIPNLVVNLANQLKRVECSIDKLNDNKWHSVEIRRDRLGDAGNNNGASSTITFRCDNRFHRFEALEESVLGQLVMGNSITAFSRLPSQLWLSRSPKYLGCIKDLVINDRYVDIYDQTSENSRVQRHHILAVLHLNVKTQEAVSKDFLNLIAIAMQPHSLEKYVRQPQKHYFLMDLMGLNTTLKINCIQVHLKKYFLDLEHVCVMVF